MSTMKKGMGCHLIDDDGFINFQGYVEAVCPAAAGQGERVKLRYFSALTGEPTNAEWFPAEKFANYRAGRAGWKTYPSVSAANADYSASEQIEIFDQRR